MESGPLFTLPYILYPVSFVSPVRYLFAYDVSFSVQPNKTHPGDDNGDGDIIGPSDTHL